MKTLICKHCGSSHVMLDANYYPNTGEISTFDKAYCGDCDGDTRLIESDSDNTTPRINYMAAPAMLAALKEALREVEGFERRTGTPQFSAWISNARAAIKLAEGDAIAPTVTLETATNPAGWLFATLEGGRRITSSDITIDPERADVQVNAHGVVLFYNTRIARALLAKSYTVKG